MLVLFGVLWVFLDFEGFFCFIVIFFYRRCLIMLLVEFICSFD